jgi:sugar lactone lactonase YvrE
VQVGAFEVAHEESYSYVSGSVTDGVVPSAVPIELSSSGACRLVRQNNPHCDPSCPSGQTCDNDGSCIPFPVNQSVGTVTIEGLLQPVEMEPTESGNLYFDTTLPHPAFEAGAPIKLTADGGDLTLYGEGVEVLETSGDGWQVVPGQALNITWMPGTDQSADITATINIDQHGTSPASLICEGPDTGCLTVPAELIDELIDLGVSGAASGSLYRRTVDSMEIDTGCVELSVFSHRPANVSVASDNDSESSADCSSLPPLPATYTQLSHVPLSEDLTFDDKGYLFGMTLGHNLTRTPYCGEPELLMPTIGAGKGPSMTQTLRGMRFLPDGDLIVADQVANSLLRVGLDGSVETIIDGLPDPNGIVVDLDGFVYVSTSGGEIRRIDPATGDSIVLLSDEDIRFDGITCSPDCKTLYFNDERGGSVYQMPIFKDGTAGDSSLLADLSSHISFALDGMAADECGNVYTIEMNGVVWRITPDGEVAKVVDLSSENTRGSTEVAFFALNFGSGYGGWKSDALYVMSFSDGVFEVHVGVRGKPEPHLQ